MKPPLDIAADLDTPVSAFRKLAPFQPTFLLESAEGGERLGRYSFIGLGRATTLRLDAQGLEVNGERASLGAQSPAGPLDRASLMNAFRGALSLAPDLLPDAGSPFAGGLVGVLAHDFVRWLERLPIPAHHQAAHVGGRAEREPDALFIAPRSLLMFDHLTRRVGLLHSGPEWERASLRREIIAALRGPLPPASVRSGHEPPAPSLSEAEFIQRVGRVKEHILAGDVFQLVLSIRYRGACRTDPFEVYRALRLLNPSPYMYFLDLGDTQIVGSSPEALVKLNAGLATLRPIAGTRPRGGDDAADRRHAEELLADAKEAAEHVMLVDLARNDLGRVVAPGSIRVDPYRAIERYSHVMHIVSGVSGRVEPGKDAFDLLAATFPAGTVSGAPKVRALQIIDELEPVARGFYAGAVGYFAKRGDMDLAIAIRTLTFRDGQYAYQAGAGIVEASDPQAEFHEIRAKVGVLEAALKLAEEGL